MAVKKAASVLPDPVGASSNVVWFPRIGGQPRACARVGPGNEASNQRRTGSWKGAGICTEIPPRASNVGKGGLCVITTRTRTRNKGPPRASKEYVSSWAVEQSDRRG